MPVGYLVAVALLTWGVACALTRWRRPGVLSALPALVVNELPFMAAYLLVAATVLAFVDGDLDSPGGTVGAAVAVLTLTGLGLVVRRALQADRALANASPSRRPWWRILRAPFVPGRRDVVRLRALPYGDGRARSLDVLHRRDRPQGVPVLLHVHGGAFRSGSRGREAKPLMRHLTSRRGFVCVDVGYRLQPEVTLQDQVADVRAALAWVRTHVAEYGGDVDTVFVAGSSAGAYLAVRAVADGETGLAGLVCRYGYYGDLVPSGDVPPLLVLHGTHDLLVPVADARAFVRRARAVSGRAVSYVELPGAHHDFDLFESIRSAAVCRAVETLASPGER